VQRNKKPQRIGAGMLCGRVFSLPRPLRFVEQEEKEHRPSMDLEKIDQLVEEYLKYRNYHETFSSFQNERKIIFERNNILKIPVDDINDRVVKALEKSDTLRLLTLWDTYVTQTLDPQNPELVTNARITEFYLHLYCATNPFRDEILKTVKSPSEAAKYAARSMTIFKHFLETRGRRLLKTPEFQPFKNFHKVAFPPTHPSFSHMFRSAWQENTKAKIVTFLSSYLQPPLPSLVNKFYDLEQQIQTIVMKREQEIKAVFRDREQKLMEFSRSIYAISNDLLNAIDEGGTIDKEFLYNFRLKFDEFHEVLGGGGAGGGGGPSSGAAVAANGGGGGGGGGGHEPMNMRSKRRKRGKNKTKGSSEPHYNELDYTVINLELSSMVSEVEHELSSYKKPGKRLGSIDIEIVMQSAMQGSALYMALLVYMIRDVDETHTSLGGGGSGDSNGPEENYGIKQTRRYAAKKFLEYDIFGLKNPPPSGGSSQFGDSSSHVSPRSGYMVTFLHAYAMNIEELCSHPYSPRIHYVTQKLSLDHRAMGGPAAAAAAAAAASLGTAGGAAAGTSVTNEEMIENHYGELFEASSATCHSLLLTFTIMMNTLSTRELTDYLSLNKPYRLTESLAKVHLTLCEMFLSFPTKPEIISAHVILKSIYKILLTALIVMGSERKHKLTFLKTGCLDYLMTLLAASSSSSSSSTLSTPTALVPSIQMHALSLSFDSYFSHLLLVYNLLESPEAYRALLSSSKSSSHCLILLNYFFFLLSQYLLDYDLLLTQQSIQQNQLFVSVLLRALFFLLNEQTCQEIFRETAMSTSEEFIRSLRLQITSSELHDRVFASYFSPLSSSDPSSLANQCKQLASNITHQLDLLLLPVSGTETKTPADEKSNDTFLTELTGLKGLLESHSSLPHSLEDLFHSYLLSLPEEFYMKEYKTMKPKDIGMNLLMNYTKSYIEEHGSLYEGTGGTD
jgi:hypothetical protein